MVRRRSVWGWTPAGRRRYALAALWLAHGLWVFYGRGPGGAWTRAGDALASPFERGAGAFQRWRDGRSDRAMDLEQAQAEVARLREQVRQLQAQAEQQAPRATEADEAALMLGLKAQVPLETRGARVVFAPVGIPFGGLILDQGADAGFREDQGVIAPEGVVGRIWSVGPTQSKVLPADAPNASIGVMLARSRATGVLQGLGGNRAEIRYLNNQEVVQPGEAVYTSGLDRVFPRGLLVGYVSEAKPGELELKVKVQLAAPLGRLHLVLVLPPQPPLEVQPPLLPAPAAQAAKGAKR